MKFQRSGLWADFFVLLLAVMVVVGMIGPVFGAESASPLPEARLMVGVGESGNC